MKIDPVVDLLLGKLHLREADAPPPEEEEDPNAAPQENAEAAPEESPEPVVPPETPVEKTDPNRATSHPTPVDELPLEDEKEVEVIGEGQIPQDSSGIEEGKFDELNAQGNIDISFEAGNFDKLEDLPTLISDKVELINHTFEPLIEKALIELLGSSSMYKRNEGNVQIEQNENGTFMITGNFIYQVSLWIGNDIDQEDISHDANYILNTLKPISDKIKITECAIDCGSGSLTISFTSI
jgi:hypothetical protein